MREASYMIQNEMVVFFLSKLNSDTEIGKIICKNPLHSVREIIEQGFYSMDGYFKFMYELICELSLKKELKL